MELCPLVRVRWPYLALLVCCLPSARLALLALCLLRNTDEPLPNRSQEEAAASRAALAAMDSDKVSAEVTLASMEALAASAASPKTNADGTAKLSRRAQERKDAEEKVRTPRCSCCRFCRCCFCGW